MKSSLKLIILVFTVIANPVCADDLNGLRASFLILMKADKEQTKKIVKSDFAYESNFILGKNPSPKKQDLYFKIASLGVISASYLLPKKWRKPALIAANIIQFSFVSHNISAGFEL